MAGPFSHNLIMLFTSVSLVGNICEILKVLGISLSSVRRESLELGARDSSLFGSLSFLGRTPVVASFSSRLASVALLSAVCFAAQLTQAQPALPIPQAAPPGGVARSQLNLNVQVRDLCFCFLSLGSSGVMLCFFSLLRLGSSGGVAHFCS